MCLLCSDRCAVLRALKNPVAAVSRLALPDHASRLDVAVAASSVLGRGLIIGDQKQVAAWVQSGRGADCQTQGLVGVRAPFSPPEMDL
jgi:hypothetical protein